MSWLASVTLISPVLLDVRFMSDDAVLALVVLLSVLSKLSSSTMF